jgi:hypothetical protein
MKFLTSQNAPMIRTIAADALRPFYVELIS